MTLCDLSSRNPNVLYELGLRQAYDLPVVLVQDDKTERIFDASGITTVSYKSPRLYEDVINARKDITNLIIENIKEKNISMTRIYLRILTTNDLRRRWGYTYEPPMSAAPLDKVLEVSL